MVPSVSSSFFLWLSGFRISLRFHLMSSLMRWLLGFRRLVSWVRDSFLECEYGNVCHAGNCIR